MRSWHPRMVIKSVAEEKRSERGVHGRWNLKGDHSFHRVGLSVDIERDPGGLRRDDGVLTRSGERLKTIVETYGGKKYKEENIHFGFDGGN